MPKKLRKLNSSPRSMFEALEETLATARFPLFARAQTERDKELQDKLLSLQPEKSPYKPPTEKLLYQIGFTNSEIFDYEIDLINKKVVALRSAYFDKIISEFIDNTFSPVIIIDLGCGLDNRSFAYEEQNVLCLNVDHKKIIELRKLLFEEQKISTIIDRNKNIFSLSINIETQFRKLIKKIKYLVRSFDREPDQLSFLFISIGVFPYFQTQKIIEILKLIDAEFKRYQISFEDFSKTLIEQSQLNSDLSKTSAQLKGHLSPNASEQLSKEGLDVQVSEFPYFTYPAFWEPGELSKYGDEESLEEVSSRILTITPNHK